MALKDLLDVPAPVQQAADALAALDRCFLVGFGRLGPDQVQTLQALERSCSGTPLAEPLGKAVAALARNEFIDTHFVVLALARASIQGAVYDALRSQVAAALGRPIEKSDAAAPAGETPAQVKVWQESTRNWLMELALAGFKQLEFATVAPFQSTLEQLQGLPQMTRLAALLTGFWHELLDALPMSAHESLPIYRWVDLWTRAMIGSIRPPLPPTGTRIDGTLSPLGADLHHHGYFVSCDVYGLLEGAAGPRVVRTTISAYKVDVVTRDEMWTCFADRTQPLLEALGKSAKLEIKGATLLPSGDLLWDGKAKVGKPFAIMDVAGQIGTVPGPGVPPLDRHPLQLAEPIFLTGYKTAKGPLLEVDGVQLPVALERLSYAAEVKAEHVLGSAALVGLLRFDGGRWSVQPLAVAPADKKAKPVHVGASAFTARTTRRKVDTLAILKGFAGRLLRAKA